MTWSSSWQGVNHPLLMAANADSYWPDEAMLSMPSLCNYWLRFYSRIWRRHLGECQQWWTYQSHLFCLIVMARTDLCKKAGRFLSRGSNSLIMTETSKCFQREFNYSDPPHKSNMQPDRKRHGVLALGKWLHWLLKMVLICDTPMLSLIVALWDT